MRCLVLATLILASIAPLSASAAPKPTETVIYDFGVVKAGRNPQAAPTLGPDGIYYGTTDGGGATGNGTVYRLIPPSPGKTAWTQDVIYAFSGAADGSAPSSGLLIDGDGALYGVTASGGAQGNGVAFRLAPPAPGGPGWTETTLHVFDGSTDGAAPFGTLAAGKDGVLYGSTVSGGSGGGGVVFSLVPPAAGQSAWTETPLYSFQFGPDGINPTGVFHDEVTGAIYGMTSGGGINGHGQVYRLTPPRDGTASWTKASLYSFRAITDGNFPVGGLVRDQNGVFYGVTDAGGLSGWGTVFSLAPPRAGGDGWLETVIYHFSGRLDGGAPGATPVLGPDGTLYGATNAGGDEEEGAVFALSPPSKGRFWTETPLASFDGPNGVNPSGVARDPSGVLIGTTFYGGTRGTGGGTIFTLTPPAVVGGTWTQAVVHQFAQVSDDAATPVGALLMGKGGVLYGSANAGGGHGQGAVFELTPPGAAGRAWGETLLHSFTGKDGSYATGKLLQGSGGVLYGVTALGGPDSNASYGLVYALIPPVPGGTGWTEQILHAFTGVPTGDGAIPASGMVADADGALYGTTGSGGLATSDNSFGNGIVYKLAPPPGGHGRWTETVLYRFSGPDGSTPQGPPLLAADGTLYGTTYIGGATGEGTVFALAPPASGSTAWTETILHSFDVSIGNDGAIPGTGPLLMDGSGALYGTASQGGAASDGAAFKLSPPTGAATAWTEALLHSFSGPDGISPYTGLVAGRNGALFGTTQQGGAFQLYGTVFELVPPRTGTDWTVEVLHSFDPTYNEDGSFPAGTPVRNAKGTLFGTTSAGGYGGPGVAYEITP